MMNQEERNQLMKDAANACEKVLHQATVDVIGGEIPQGVTILKEPADFDNKYYKGCTSLAKNDWLREQIFYLGAKQVDGKEINNKEGLDTKWMLASQLTEFFRLKGDLQTDAESDFKQDLLIENFKEIEKISAGDIRYLLYRAKKNSESTMKWKTQHYFQKRQKTNVTLYKADKKLSQNGYSKYDFFEFDSETGQIACIKNDSPEKRELFQAITGENIEKYAKYYKTYGITIGMAENQFATLQSDKKSSFELFEESEYFRNHPIYKAFKLALNSFPKEKQEFMIEYGEIVFNLSKKVDRKAVLNDLNIDENLKKKLADKYGPELVSDYSNFKKQVQNKMARNLGIPSCQYSDFRRDLNANIKNMSGIEVFEHIQEKWVTMSDKELLKNMEHIQNLDKIKKEKKKGIYDTDITEIASEIESQWALLSEKEEINSDVAAPLEVMGIEEINSEIEKIWNSQNDIEEHKTVKTIAR